MGKEAKKKEKSLKEARVKREKRSKELRAKELKAKEKKTKEKNEKEKASKERNGKEKKTKEAKSKEVKAKEGANKERNTKEKKTKEVNSKVEKAQKEKLPKERKAKEVNDKEKKSKEQKSKERKKKESIQKESNTKEGKAKELKAKERANKEKKAKEKKTKESQNKEHKAKEIEQKKKPTPKELDDCIAAAHASIKDVIREVRNQQEMINNLSDGSKCKTSACRCMVKEQAERQFTIASKMTAFRVTTILRETKVVCMVNARAKKTGQKLAMARCKNLSMNDLDLAKYKPMLKLHKKLFGKEVASTLCAADRAKEKKAKSEKKAKVAVEKIHKHRESIIKKEKAAKKKEVADKAAKKEKKAKADEKKSKEAKSKTAEKTKKIKEKETKKGVLCQPETKPGKVAVDVTIVIDGSGSVGTDGWKYSVNAATKMASSFGLGSRVSAAVFSNSFKWLTRGPFTTPDKAAAAIKKAYFPRGSTNTANALAKTLSHIKSRGSKGAKQIVYVITDGRPNSEHRTATAASQVRKVARLAFIPVGRGAPVSKMKSWASKPTSANVFYAKDFKALSHQLKKAVKSTC